MNPGSGDLFTWGGVPAPQDPGASAPPTLCARVLIDGPQDLAFDYAIPPHLEISPGCRVRVLLRNRPATGTVLDVADLAETARKASIPPEKIRPVSQLIDPTPLISPQLLELAKWAADYYSAPLEQMIRCLLPERIRQENTAEKQVLVARLLKDPDPDTLAKLEKRAPRQAQVLRLLAMSSPDSTPLTQLSGGAAAAKTLAKAGWLEIFPETRLRDPDAGREFVPSSPLTLNPEQANALVQIRATIDTALSGERPLPLLLHGVTGAGKTEVYLQAVAYALENGKNALILVPEISLTPQTLQRFKSRFAHIPGCVAVLHSNLSTGERFDEWQRIRKGAARVVIGARSAVFAPIPNLALTIVDEEHDGAYKQDSSPRYHGRDLAVLRAHLESAAILLGSATPSLESWQNTRSGKYRLVELTRRADGQSMPVIRVLDMKLEARKLKDVGGPAILSDRLRAEITHRLERGEQSILFLNRRGFARSIQCGQCGHVVQCPHCSIAMTYHRADERLMCHMCGNMALAPRTCPECGDAGILLQGYGTQKVEEIIRKVFRNARIARIDADIAQRKNAVREILDEFRARKIDILLGTQMIAKGLDFPGVTLVGILNADLGLHVPDFRSGERVFQLLTQVAGRAGRGDLEGEVIIQTFTPHSPSIQFARQHDTAGFATQELEFRSMFGYPPFTHVILLTSRSTSHDLAELSMQNFVKRLKPALPPDVVLTDAMPAPIERAHGQFRFQSTLRGTNARLMSRIARQTLAELNLGDDVVITIDVDAQSFL